MYRKSCKPLCDFFFPVCSKDDESFQNIWSNSTPASFPFPNYCAASEFSTLATEHVYNILFILDFIKKEKEKALQMCFLSCIKYTNPNPLI